MSLQSRNWEEVGTLVIVVVALSAAVELWSSKVRAEVATAPAPRRSRRGRQAQSSRLASAAEAGRAADAEGLVVATTQTPPIGSAPHHSTARRPWTRVTLYVLLPALALSWWTSGVTLQGLVDPRTWDLTRQLLVGALPASLPTGGAPALTAAVLDTLAMAVLTMALAVAITVALAPWSVRERGPRARQSLPRRVLRGALRHGARLVLLTLRSIPPTVWAVFALFLLYPGVLPGALALGLYAGGILGRLVAEAWEGQSVSARQALMRTGAPGWLAGAAATVPPSFRQLVTYTLYRFEVSVRDTTVVGVVGAAGLGRLLAEALASFRYPLLATLLLTSFAVSAVVELTSKRIRRVLTT